MNSYKTEDALGETNAFLQDRDISLDELEIASGFEFMALQAHAAEKILVNDADRSEYVSLANRVKDAFKALLPTLKRKKRHVACRPCGLWRKSRFSIRSS